MKTVYGLIGSPGSGKSTQAELLVKLLEKERESVAYVNVGQILRESKDKDVISVMNSGELVADEIIFKVLEKTFSSLRNDSLVILDGFFRRVSEANWLIARSEDFGIRLDKIIDIKLSKREATKRLSKRGRGDDSPEDIRVRLKVFARERKGLLKLIRKLKIEVVSVDGKGTREEVFERICSKLKLK